MEMSVACEMIQAYRGSYHCRLRGTIPYSVGLGLKRDRDLNYLASAHEALHCYLGRFLVD